MIIIITVVIAKIYGEKVWKILSRMPGLYGCPMLLFCVYPMHVTYFTSNEN